MDLNVDMCSRQNCGAFIDFLVRRLSVQGATRRTTAQRTVSEHHAGCRLANSFARSSQVLPGGMDETRLLSNRNKVRSPRPPFVFRMKLRLRAGDLL